MSDGGDRERAPLTVAADLSLSVGGAEATLHSTGERLFLEFPSLVAAVRAFRSFPTSERHRLHARLSAADLALEVRARNRTLVAFGTGTRSGPLARRLGLDPAELRLCGSLSAAWAGTAATVERLR